MRIPSLDCYENGGRNGGRRKDEKNFNIEAKMAQERYNNLSDGSMALRKK